MVVGGQRMKLESRRMARNVPQHLVLKPALSETPETLKRQSHAERNLEQTHILAAKWSTL